MALALDGSGHANAGSSASLNVSLTTTNANDIIILAVTTNGGPVNSLTSPSLTWHSKASDGAGTNVIELWYAIASGALSSETISVGTVSSNFITADAFGISGADTSTIFDGSAVTGNPDPLSITTTNANTFIIGAYRENSASNPTQGTGFTKISGADYQLTEYKIVSSTQSGLSVAQGTGAGGANGGIAIAVIQAAGGGGSSFIAKPYLINQAPKRASYY